MSVVSGWYLSKAGQIQNPRCFGMICHSCKVTVLLLFTICGSFLSYISSFHKAGSTFCCSLVAIAGVLKVLHLGINDIMGINGSSMRLNLQQKNQWLFYGVVSQTTRFKGV